MSITAVTKYQKLGGTFASGEEAYADKNSMYTAEFSAAVDQWLADQLEAGILLEPTTVEWDADTHTLTITRKILNNMEEFSVGRPSIDHALAKAEDSGWTLLGQEIILD